MQICIDTGRGPLLGQGPTVLAVGAGWGLFGHLFSLSMGDGSIKPRTSNHLISAYIQIFVVMVLGRLSEMNPRLHLLATSMFIQQLHSVIQRLYHV